MDEHDDDKHLSRLAEEAESLAGSLPDARRRYKVPDGIVPGTLEYKKWQVEHEKMRRRLYQKRSYLRRRKLALALQKYTEGEQTTVEQAIAVVNDELKQLREVTAASTIPARATPVVVSDDKKQGEIAFVREMADKHNVSYVEAYKIMFAEDYEGEDSFEKKQAAALEDIIGKPLAELD